MKRFVIPLMLFLLIGLENSLFEYAKAFGVKPGLVLTFAICYALAAGNPRGVIIGVIGGILEDIFFPGVFGINSIAFMLTVYLLGLLESKIYKDNIIVPAVLTFAGTIFKELIVFMFLYLTKNSYDFIIAFNTKILGEAIYNSVLTIIFFGSIVKLENKLYSEEGWRF